LLRWHILYPLLVTVKSWKLLLTVKIYLFLDEIRITHSNPNILAATKAWMRLLVALITRSERVKDLKQIYSEVLESCPENIESWVKQAKS